MRRRRSKVLKFAAPCPAGLSLEIQPLLATRPPRWLDSRAAGKFIGTRQRALPLAGLRMRLSGPASDAHEISANALFLGSPVVSRHGRDIEIVSAAGVDPLVGLRFELVSATPGGGRLRRGLRRRFCRLRRNPSFGVSRISWLRRVISAKIDKRGFNGPQPTTCLSGSSPMRSAIMPTPRRRKPRSRPQRQRRPGLLWDDHDPNLRWRRLHVAGQRGHQSVL